MSFFVTSVGRSRAGTSAAWRVRTGTARRWRKPLARVIASGAHTEHPVSRAQQPGFRQRARSHRQGRLAERQGVVIARDVNDLHSANNKITRATALDEHGRLVNGQTETPNKHGRKQRCATQR